MNSISLPVNEDELITLVKNELYTAVIGDIMDKLGLLNQFLPPEIKPLHCGMTIAGKAMTVLGVDEAMDSKSKPFGLMLEALDDLKKNEVYICSGTSPSYALWGELMSARAKKLGAAGAVVNGYSRDTKGILEMGFPTFSFGSYAKDQAPRGKVVDFRSSIEINGVVVNSGDYVVGDRDGVCIVPKARITEVFSLALEKARGENFVHKKILEGMSAKEAFETYGIM